MFRCWMMANIYATNVLYGTMNIGFVSMTEIWKQKDAR